MMRYVVLHHTGWIEDHFDLMLDTDGVSALKTWRLDQYLQPRTITPLPDHRRVYLEYEGPVSNDRGEVRRVDAGAVMIETESPRAWLVRLTSETGRESITLALPL